MIQVIEIQITSYCNRKCEWCPPYKNKLTQKLKLNFKSLVKLRNFYNKHRYLFAEKLIIDIGRFGEPLSSFDYLLHVARFIKANFNCQLQLSTNGDFLTKDKLDKLTDFDIIFVSRYDETEIFPVALKKILSICNSKTLNKIKYKKKRNIISINYLNFDIVYRYMYHTKMQITSRGNELMNDYNFRERKGLSKCELIGRCFMIDYNSNVLPCCEVSSMNKSHMRMICGNLQVDYIGKILDNMQHKTSIDNPVCQYCNVNPDSQLSFMEVEYD